MSIMMIEETNVVPDDGMVNGEIRILTHSGALYSIMDNKISRKSEFSLDERLKINEAGFAEVGTVNSFLAPVRVGSSLIVSISNPVFTRQTAVRSTPVVGIYIKALSMVISVGSINVEIDRTKAVGF